MTSAHIITFASTSLPAQNWHVGVRVFNLRVSHYSVFLIVLGMEYVQMWYTEKQPLDVFCRHMSGIFWQ